MPAPTPTVVSAPVATFMASTTELGMRAAMSALPTIFSALPSAGDYPNGYHILASIDDVFSVWKNNSGTWFQIL